MDSDAKNGFKRNDILSQSYAERVERVAQQKNDGQFSFDLPKEVLEEREKVWGNFFDKYADEASDEVELDMNTMKPAADNEEDEDEDDEEEDEEKECYTKCRAPLRKLPALIQYWIDTGNPPYQLVGDEDATETGSSLSEGEHSRSGHSAIIREISENHKSNTSRCSSVDTAAYILSNTNITKKSETIAIVEGAKSFNDDFLRKTSPLNEISANAENPKNSTIPSSSNRSPKSPAKISQATNSLASKTAAEYEKFMSTPVKTNSSFLVNSELEKIASPSQQSVKLSDILPEIQEFDEMLQRAITKSPPLTRLSLAKNRVKPKNVKLNETSFNATENSSGRKKLQNRRKLYTGRDSPVDLVVEKANGDFVQNLRHSLHPALETTEISRDDKAARLAARARRRKRKRASRNLDANSQDGNTSQESDQKIGEENSKGDARYTDFFESLGLTPSKIGSGNIRVRKSLPKRTRKIQRDNLPRKAKEETTINDSTESSMKESADTEDALSPVGKNENSTEKSVKKILGDKILSVRVKRLSDEFLAPYARKVTAKFEKNKEFLTSESKSSSGSSPDKKNRSNLGKIELLTTLTHDSDSSTILICSCNDNNVGQSDNDAFLSSKNKSKIRRISMRTRAAKLTNKSTDEEINKVSEKMPFVKLEKLNIDRMKIADNLRNEIDKKDSVFRFGTSSSPVKSGKKNNLFASNENDDATISRQIFGQFSRNEKLREKSIAKKDRFSLGISISSDEDEDSFEKIISKIEHKRYSTKLEGNNREKKSTEKMENLSNGDERNEAEKKQNLYVIATSSDEEVTKRRTRNFASRNDKNPRKKMTKTMSTLKNLEKMEVENSETRKTNEYRRSTRRKLSANLATKNHISTTNSCGKSNNTKNLFENSEKSDLKNSENLPPWENRDLNLRDENLDVENILEIFDKSAKGINQNNKKIVRNSTRFQTSIDSDSDTEFEGLRFALNDKYLRKNEKQIFEKQMEIEKTENTRTSPRRNFKNLSDKKREIGEKSRQERGKNLFKESKSLEENVNSLENENMEIEDFVNNRDLTVNDFPTNEAKDFVQRKKKIRSKREFQEERKTRKKSNSKNDDSGNSPISKKKKLRKIKILGNPMDWESESENDSNQNKIISTNRKQARENEISRKSEGIEQRKTKNLFASSPNDTAEDFDALFSEAAKTRGAKKAVIDKLNFSSAKKYKNLSVGLTNLCFKTKLRSDTEDDGET